MQKSKKILFIILSSAFALVSATIIFQSEKEDSIDRLLMQSLNTVHFSPMPIDNNFSEKVYKLYMERLDYNKKFLIQSDVDELKKYHDLIDDDINAPAFTFFDKSLEIINKRIIEGQDYYKEILATPFDFTTQENLELDPEKTVYAKNKNALKEEWRKYLKYQTLTRVVDMLESQDKAKEKNDTVVLKSKEELEVDARKKVLKSNDDYFKRLKGFNRNDRISVYFNCITGVYDPHTEFYAPKDKAQFDIGMSGQLEGIGAQLQEKDGYIKVNSIVPGSPSYKQGQLKAGDLILKVAQGAGEPIDIVDMRMDDAVQLIRGKKGTEVRLTVKKPDGSITVIPIVRDIVVIEETYAQSVILNGKKKVGYIKLPSFYADFSGSGGRSCSKDIKKELQKLKSENVEGVILDLRFNGGGSLPDVVDMAGLFINEGPVVQIKQKSVPAQVLEDTDPGVVYNGPLIVMINANSASASEILAAAVQDYKRGVIVGTSPSSFGKGTVQRFFDLDDYLPPAYANIKPLGAVKITTQKFYRVSGGSTQLKGVIPDIVLPDPYSLLEQGEKEQENPIAWDEIAPAKYQPLKPTYSVEQLKANSSERIKHSAGFTILGDSAKRLKKQKDNTVVSLNLDKYVEEQKIYKEEAKKMELALNKEIEGMEVNTLKEDLVPVTDTVKANRNNDWYKTLKKDIYLNETLTIMNEMK